MSWKSGGELFVKIVKAINGEYDNIHDVYNELIDAFEEMDCDTLYHAEGIDTHLDSVLKERGLIDSHDSY